VQSCEVRQTLSRNVSYRVAFIELLMYTLFGVEEVREYATSTTVGVEVGS